MASARSPLPLVFLVIALPSILAAPATTLFDLNKLGIHGISAISGNCAGASLTPESYLYCAIKDKTFEGEVGIDIRIGTGYLQRVSANPMPFALPDPVDNAPASERFSFPASGKDYNVIFLDRDILRVYAAPDATAAATTILTTMLDETYPAAVNPACQIQVSTDARAVAFKNCVPKTPPVQNARADANTRQSNADGTHASTEGTNAESVAETSGRLTDAPSTDDTPTGLRYGLLSESLLPSAEIQERCRFIPPLKNPEITSEFGTPRQYNGRSYSHDGIDIVGNPTIIAPADGKIVSVFGAHEGGACGNGMSMEFTGCSATMGKPIYGTFCHLQDVPSLKVGQAVKQGQTLGTMGGTGSANGAVHLHYGVRIGCVEASCAVNPKPYLANGYAPRVLAAKDALLEFAGKTASQETMEFAETQTQKTRIVAIKSNPGSCPQDASFQTLPDFSGGNKACVYFYVDQKDGAKDAFFDVAFSGYGNDKGGCFAARAVLHKPGVQYPEQYRNLPAGTTPVYIQALSERPNYAGFYYVEVPIRQNFGNAVNGLVLNMYLSDATTDFSKYTEKEGISRKPRTDQKIAGKLTCQTFSTQTATAASLQGKKFVIDAGHGTPYSEGQGSYVGANPQEATLHEHQVTLKVAERLVEQLKARQTYRSTKGPESPTHNNQNPTRF
ncbi:peptidoglycan DD-metalloendopeptidase family protein [Candidatus Micrarchaeota archaeon]|nr:peptidoglycan DD-metalloendopeptidase family protein [Candidatus Micrarchaeota archaeon]